MTLTFTVESMAAANAILRHRRMQQIRKKVEEEVDNDIRPDDADYSDSSSSPTRSLVIFKLVLNVTLTLLHNENSCLLSI